ncbi:hypothetical protein PM3_1220 [Pasteurella multocida]|nr:hypothetical protein PM3_1220 [Pasteurella multocida]
MGCVHCFLLKVKNGVSLEGIGEKASGQIVGKICKILSASDRL